MKTKIFRILIPLSASLIMLMVPVMPAYCAEATAAMPEPRDSVVEKATLSLIESIGELSKTANKLSEVISRWDEEDKQSQSKGNADRHTDNVPKTQVTPQNQKSASLTETEESEEVEFISDNGVFIGEEETQSGGSYIWIPDSLAGDVRAFLTGDRTVTGIVSAMPGQSINVPDLNEMVNWRGTKIPMALHTKRLGRYDRKLYNWLIYPKGLWHLGLTANYGELDTENSELLQLMKEIDIKGKIYSIKPSVSYFIRNNACVGIRLAFTKGDLGINSFKVDIDEDMNFNLHDIKYTSDSYSAAVFYQQYFGLSRRGRFAVFNEAELSAGTGSTHFIRPFDGSIRDTRTKTQSVNLNYSPGVSIMMMKNAAFNLSFGIFGFHLKTEKQWENGEACGSRTTSGINFRFNIFNINFGVAIII